MSYTYCRCCFTVFAAIVFITANVVSSKKSGGGRQYEVPKRIVSESTSGQTGLPLTENQRSRILHGYSQIKIETSFDNRSRYLYGIINSRPENMDIEVGEQCEFKPLKLPDFRSAAQNFEKRKKQKLRLSDYKCLEYLWKIRYYEEIDIAKARCDNGMEDIVNLHIPDGTHSDHPHMGAIGWQSKKSKDTWLFICEGALISENHLLTSANCTQLPKTYKKKVSDVQPKVVRLGTYDISDKEEVGKSPLDVLISKITTHPKYKLNMPYSDIAIIKIEKNLVFSSMIHPACIWTDMETVTDTVLLTGWYDVESNKKVKKKEVVITSSFNVLDTIILHNRPKPVENTPGVPVNKFMMQLKTIELEKHVVCEKLTERKRSQWFRGILNQHQCGFSRTEKNCKPDRGTILQQQIKIPEITDWKMHYIVGVKSLDFGCGRAKNLAIFSRLSVYIDWIEETVWPEKESE